MYTDGYQYKGEWFSRERFFNLNLEIENIKVEQKQVVFKIQDGIRNSISDIMFGDIDNDNELDLIYSICNITCKYRLGFLSSHKDDSNKLLKYMGSFQDYCIYP